jgi:hypothetical protein
LESLFQQVKRLDLPLGEFAIFGSGPLIVRRIITATNDLDIVCRGAAWEKAMQIGKTEYLEEHDVTVVTMCDGRISFGTKWGIGNFDVDKLIDSAELIDGLLFVRLEYVVSYKMERASVKDMRHIEALKSS